jgi:hypothetical protein
VAVLVASIASVTVVLPQAYALDPTGLGSALGTVDESEAFPPVRTDTFNEAFGPSGAGDAREHEFKLYLQKTAKVEFECQVHADANTTLEFYFDRHGEPENAPKDEFTSYETGHATRDSGTLEAPFTAHTVVLEQHRT